MSTRPSRLASIADFTRELRCIGVRLANWEDVPQAELDAFEARKQALFAQLGETEPW